MNRLLALALLTLAPFAVIAQDSRKPITNADVIAAHEASAIASIMMVGEAELIYASSHPDQGYTGNLAMLGSPGEETIDNDLASGHKLGYTLTYTPGKKLKHGAIRSYTITAVPDQMGTTGQRRFFADESGEIRYNATGPADRSSPVICSEPSPYDSLFPCRSEQPSP